MMESIYVGVDLGSFNTAVACSNGLRETVQSVVGYPKDHVSRQILGRSVIFGDEIHQHRLALDVVRPFHKGALKYQDLAAEGVSEKDAEKQDRAAQLLVKHAVSAVKPSPGATVCGVIGTPARASRISKQSILKIVEEVLDVAMLVPEPFAVGYGINQLVDTLVVDIGAGTIDVCPMYGALPTEQELVSVPFGGDFIDEDFRDRTLAVYPRARLSLNMAREIKEKHGFVGDEHHRVKVKLPISGRPPQELDVTEPLQQACEAMVPAVIQGIHGLIERLDPEFHQAILSNIVLAGGGSQLKGLDRALEDALKEYGCISVTRVYDTVFAGAAGALGLAMNVPTEHWDCLRATKREAAACV
jgi:rod shape-determining protein MreB